MEDTRSTVAEYHRLPSNGFIYGVKYDPELKIRCMNTKDEMILTSAKDVEYRKTLCEVLDSCVEGELPVSTYDMCMGDFIFIMHKVRTITYGSKYKFTAGCPHCKKVQEAFLNLDDLKVNTIDGEITDKLIITLPVSKDVIKLKLETPRISDSIKAEATRRKESENLTYDPTMSIRIQTLVDTINGQVLESIQKEHYVDSMNARDSKYIIKKIEEINGLVGIDPAAIVKCSAESCGKEFLTFFRLGPEFFNPTIDE